MSNETSRSHANSGFSELLNLTKPAETASIEAITTAISAVLEKLGIDEQKRMEIDLAVQEALVNAVVHGCKEDASKSIGCRLEGDAQGRVLITVSDPGPGFRPESLPDPKQPEKIYKDHGRGVYLIRELMDEVHFERGGAQIKMWKY